MRDHEITIRLTLPRLKTTRWLIIGAVAILGGAVALAAIPVFTDGTTLKAADLNALGAATVPSGAVMHFNLVACPTGWTELTAASGRYLVGLPPSGTLAGTAGTPLGDKEDRPAGQHSHGVTDPGHGHSTDEYIAANTNPSGGWVGGAGSTPRTGAGLTGVVTTGVTINNFGTVAGTNAPYIQFLVCQKN